MFGPDYKAGCTSCSSIADGFDGLVVHLANHDVMLSAVSRAPLATLQSYQKRMGWSVKWVSSFHNDFNRDYYVTATPEEIEAKRAYYNYAFDAFPGAERPGISVFYKDADGAIYHTYSCYARGLDMLNGAYHLLDLVPKGRDEKGLPYPMEWLRHRDRYEDRPPTVSWRR